MIKYIGSKRRLVPVLGELFSASGALTALDLFTGTTRVAQELKRRGAIVTAADIARYSEVFARCYIETASEEIDKDELRDALDHLNSLRGLPGYFTDTFCVRSRFFQPFNGERIDAIRDVLDAEYIRSPLYPILLTSLIEAADRVDSTTGVQMAYVKDWAPRSFKPLEMRPPELISGRGDAALGDAVELASCLGEFDFVYLDPPYNQHRYFTNYHVWETLVAWDRPAHYGVACKRADAREQQTKSDFNKRKEMPVALRTVIDRVRSGLLVVSYNNESWISKHDLEAMCAVKGHVVTLAYDSKRYVGAQIGIYNPAGSKVGAVSHLRNLEYVVVAGERQLVERVVAGRAAHR